MTNEHAPTLCLHPHLPPSNFLLMPRSLNYFSKICNMASYLTAHSPLSIKPSGQNGLAAGLCERWRGGGARIKQSRLDSRGRRGQHRKPPRVTGQLGESMADSATQSSSGTAPVWGWGAEAYLEGNAGGQGEGLAMLLTAQAHSSQNPPCSVGFGEKAWPTAVSSSTLSLLPGIVEGCGWVPS